MTKDEIDKHLGEELTITLKKHLWLLVYMSVLNQIDFLSKYGFKIFSRDNYLNLAAQYKCIKETFEKCDLDKLKNAINALKKEEII